ALNPAQILAAVARLPDDDDGEDHREGDADEPDSERHRSAVLRAVGVTAVGERGGRASEHGDDGSAQSDRRRAAPRDHACEATRDRKLVQLLRYPWASLRRELNGVHGEGWRPPLLRGHGR